MTEFATDNPIPEGKYLAYVEFVDVDSTISHSGVFTRIKLRIPGQTRPAFLYRPGNLLAEWRYFFAHKNQIQILLKRIEKDGTAYASVTLLGIEEP